MLLKCMLGMALSWRCSRRWETELGIYAEGEMIYPCFTDSLAARKQFYNSGRLRGQQMFAMHVRYGCMLHDF